MPMICIFPDCTGHKMSLKTARKKGSTTLKGGVKQQVWHCRECGRTWQTDQAGAVVDPGRRKKRAVPEVGRND